MRFIVYLLFLFLLAVNSSLVSATQNPFNIKVNINKASKEELKKIPGIGEVLASRIIEYREKVGGFKSIEELKNVKGIGEKKFEAIKPYVTLDTSSEKTNPPHIKGEVRNKERTDEKKPKIYQYIDDQGIIHYTQFPELIPEKYRSTLKEVN